MYVQAVTATPPPSPGAVTRGVRLLMRLEGAMVAALSVALFVRGDVSWTIFAVFFLAPDVSLAGYLAGPRVGASVYNAAHSYVGPILLILALLVSGRSFSGWPAATALIWTAHIGFDRMLGFGLKYTTGFGDTHLGKVGRSAAPTHETT